MLPVLFLLLALADEGESLPIEKAVVHTASEPGGQGVFARLSRDVVVVASPPADKRALAVAYALGAAPEPSEFVFPKFRSRDKICALTVGPLLDSPDQVTVKSLTRRGEELELLIEHTQVRAEGAQLRRNIIKRPMVEAPISVPAGTYRMTVIWKPIPTREADKPFALEPVKHVSKFTIEQ